MKAGELCITTLLDHGRSISEKIRSGSRDLRHHRRGAEPRPPPLCRSSHPYDLSVNEGTNTLLSTEVGNVRASAACRPNCRKRLIVSLRYEKQVPGHHVRVDVKFLQFKGADGRTRKRYQFTAIDDATRIRALRIYERHNQQSAIDFIDEVVERFPFRIHTIRTDNGHEWQARFHWHVEDLGIRHVYIRPRSPNLNGTVERLHLTDQLEFYQLLDYTGDVDLRAKLAVWEEFHNVHRPHTGAEWTHSLRGAQGEATIVRPSTEVGRVTD